MLEFFANLLASFGRHRIIPREQDGHEEKYLERYYILSTPWIGIYLHKFWLSDDDGLHNHPWPSISIPLKTGFYEEIPYDTFFEDGATVTKFRKPWRPWAPWRIYPRTANAFHRIILPKEQEGKTWSLFIRFKRKQEWGFYRNGKFQLALIQSRKELVTQ